METQELMQLQWYVTRTKHLNSFFWRMLQVVLIKNCQKGVKGGLKHNKIQYVAKLNIRSYHLQKQDIKYMNIREICWFQEKY